MNCSPKMGLEDEWEAGRRRSHDSHSSDGQLLRGGGTGSRRNAGKFSVVRNERRKSFRVVLDAVGEEIPPIHPPYPSDPSGMPVEAF